MPWWAYALLVGYAFGAAITAQTLEKNCKGSSIFPIWTFWPITMVIYLGWIGSDAISKWIIDIIKTGRRKVRH